MPSVTLEGFVPPLITPLHPDGSLDTPTLRRLSERVVAAGAAAVFALGTSAEFSLLSEGMRRQVVATVLGAVGDQVPVLVGISDTGAPAVLERARSFQGMGAHALVISPPFYFPFTQTEIASFLQEVLAATELPIVLYNIPSLAQNALSVDLVAELAENPRVLGIKDSSGDFMYFQELLWRVKSVRPDFGVLQGREALCGASILMGADGIVPGLGNLAPELCMRLLQAGRAGDLNMTRILQSRLTDLEGIYAVGTKAIAGLKAAMALAGWGTSWPMAPNAPLDAQGMERVRAILARHQPVVSTLRPST